MLMLSLGDHFFPEQDDFVEKSSKLHRFVVEKTDRRAIICNFLIFSPFTFHPYSLKRIAPSLFATHIDIMY